MLSFYIVQEKKREKIVKCSSRQGTHDFHVTYYYTKNPWRVETRRKFFQFISSTPRYIAIIFFLNTHALALAATSARSNTSKCVLD